MPKRSTIERLPEDILAKLQTLLQDPRVSQLDATARINEILEAEGHPDKVSKSAVNRYAVRMNEVGQRLRQSREVAQMYISHVGAAPQGQTGLLINEMLRSMAFELSLRMQDADLEDPDAMSATIGQIKNLALTMQRLEQGATINVKREAEIRKQALQEAATKVEKTLRKNKGASDQMIEQIRADILGVEAPQ